MARELPDDRGHILTIDVEEYFQSPALRDIIIPEEWASLPSRVERTTERQLDVLADHGVKASFFIGPWIADRNPDLVEEISARGHEVASRDGAGPSELGEGGFTSFSRIRAFKSLLETLTGDHVHGHRPARTERRNRRDLVFRLVREGYSYVSWLGASSGAENGSHADRSRQLQVTSTDAGDLVELPLVGLELLGVEVPLCDRPSLRHVPLEAVRRGLEAKQRQGVPGVLTLRSWEVDEHQPRFALSPVNRAFQYARLDAAESRLETLLDEYQFTSARRRLGLGHGQSRRRTVLSTK